MLVWCIMLLSQIQSLVGGSIPVFLGGRVLDLGRSMSCKFPHICPHHRLGQSVYFLAAWIQLVTSVSIYNSSYRVVELYDI